LPGITLGKAVMANSVHDFNMPGEALDFDDLTIQFLVDEKMANYLAIHDWMIGLGFPEGHKWYRELISAERNAQGYSENSKAVSDCSLTILDSDNKPLKRFTFTDAFPVSLTGLTFQANNSDVQYLVATLTISYSYYSVS
jgi:hypothetical protein